MPKPALELLTRLGSRFSRPSGGDQPSTYARAVQPPRADTRSLRLAIDGAPHRPVQRCPWRPTPDGSITATLTSVAPRLYDVLPEDVERVASLLGWSPAELDPAFPPKIAYAGARHLILAAQSRKRLARLDYDFEGLKAYMLERDLTTVDLVWRDDPLTFHVRNPFPVGGVVEDPATGAAAAAFGAYLRELGAIEPPARVTILQGQDIGWPSTLLVDIDSERPEIQVTGSAVPLEG